MIKRYELVNDCAEVIPSYNYGMRYGLCVDILSEYFDLSDKPETITAVFSDKEHQNSYFIKHCDVADVYITLSNGMTNYHSVFNWLEEVIEMFGGSVWLSIE